ncbi:TPA_asm: integrase [Capsaspora MELD virus 1]|nr:TPA_asm: integrase [Capsaspora MELD virus 1]
MIDIKKLYADPKIGLTGLVAFQQKLKEMGIVKSLDELKDELSDVRPYNQLVPVKYKYETRKIIVRKVDEQFQADLLDTSAGLPKEGQGNFKFLLCVIDVLSKYAWVVPVKDKSGTIIARALDSIFRQAAPQRLQTDNGKEFYNKNVEELLQEYDVHLFSTFSDKKAAVVERFIYTLRQRISRWMASTQSYDYLDALQDLVSNYNNTVHSTIGMTPAQARKPQNYGELINNFFRDLPEVKPARYRVGDFVRTAKYKGTFTKASLVGNWNVEIMRVRQVRNSSPHTYLLEDLKGEDVSGVYYEAELQSVKESELDAPRLIETVLEKRTKAGKKEMLVKYIGYPKKFNEWIPER